MAAPLLQAQQPPAAPDEASGRKSLSGSGSGADKWGITAEGTGGTGSSAQSAVATLLGPRGVARYQLAAGQSAGVQRPLTVDLAGVADTGRRVVVADLREFRAKLPFRLYNAGGWREGVFALNSFSTRCLLMLLAGLDPRPATLEVGDYVLAPGIVVERK